MFIPGIFDDDFLNDFFGFTNACCAPNDKMIEAKDGKCEVGSAGRGTFSRLGMMKTDVKELDDAFELSMELPGYKKEEIKAQLKDGNLTITAETKSEESEEKKDKYIRKERYYGKVSRSFYVGDAVTEEDIKGKFENGVLTVTVPKKEKEPETAKYISIEG